MNKTSTALLLVSLAGAGIATFLVAPAFSGPFDGSGQSGTGGGASTSAPTFTSTQTDGGAGFCFNGSCTVSLASDGGVVTLNGAELYVPNGFTDSQKVNADTNITPNSVVAQAASGQRAFGPAHDGARIYFGESGNVYCFNSAGEVNCQSAWKIPTISTDTIGSYTSNRVVDAFNLHHFPVSSLGTCNGVGTAGNIPEGTIKVLSGASLSGQSRICACVSDGAGTLAFTWINTGCPNTAGTDTTCPACP